MKFFHQEFDLRVVIETVPRILAEMILPLYYTWADQELHTLVASIELQ